MNSGSDRIATLSTTFDRPLDTNNTVQDFKLKLDTTIDATYAHGYIIGNTV